MAAAAESPWLSPLVKPVSPYASTPSGIEIADGRAYLTTGETLAVFDVSDPTAPAFLGFDATRGSTAGLVVRDGFAFLVDGLDVHNVRDPESFALPVVASFPPSDNRTFSSVGSAGDFVFCHGYAAPLTIFTFSDAPNFAAVRGVSFPTDNGLAQSFYARAIKLAGDVLYLAGGDDDWGALQMYRFLPNDPQNPGMPFAEYLGEFRIIDTSFPPTGAIREIEIVGDVAYIADTGLGLALLDVSNPAVPSLLSILSPEPGDIALAGNLLLATEPSGVLRIYDLTDPSAPAPRGAVTLDGEASQLAVSGTIAFLAGFDPGLVSVDFSNPDAPVVIGQIKITSKRARGVAASGDLLYAVGNSGIDVYDVADRRHPVLITPGSGGVHYSLAIDGTMAAVQLETFSTLDIYDLGPGGRTPSLLTRNTIRELRNVVFSDGTLFACTRGDGLIIYDVNASGTLSTRGSWGAAEDKWVEQVAVSGDFAFAHLGSHPSGDPGFVVLDISNLAAPVQIGSLHGLVVRGIVLEGDFAYIAQPSSFNILDISDPANPRLAASLPFPDTSLDDITLSGGFAFVRSGYPDNTVFVIDVLDPNAPFVVTIDAGIDRVQGLSADGRFLYLARGELGLQILDLSLPVPQLEISSSPLRLSWDAPAGTRFPVESSQDLTSWHFHGRLAEKDLQPLLDSFAEDKVFLRARSN